MAHVAQRFGFRIGRGWLLLLLVVGLLYAGMVLAVPLQEIPPELRLLAVGDSVASTTVTLEGRRTAEGTVRFPLPLVVRNTGTDPERPRRLVLSMPPQFRVVTASSAQRGEVTPGVPLRRYGIRLRAPLIPDDSALRRLPGLDTLWIEANLPRYTCILHGAGVPEFQPAASHDPATIASLRVFYSFEMSDGDRSTGLLELMADPSLLDVQPAPMPPSFPVTYDAIAGAAPDSLVLTEVGSRDAYCGPPEQPIELHTVVSETEQGGRVYAIHVDGEPRKRLYDLNADGIIELEVWDGDGDGRFDARREARFAVPDFLVPQPPVYAHLLAPDTTTPDSAWLALFSNPRAGLWRFLQYARADSIRAVVDSLVALENLDTVAPADSAWLALFRNTRAGPFRFARAAVDTLASDSLAAARRAAQGAGAPNTPGAAQGAQRMPGAQTDRVARDTTGVARDTTRPRPLGTPVRIPPDTTTGVDTLRAGQNTVSRTR